MTLADIIGSIQTSLQNVGYNQQQGNTPSTAIPVPDQLDLKKSDLLNQRAQLAKQIRHETDKKRIYQDAKKQGYVPQQPVDLNSLRNSQIEQVINADPQPQVLGDSTPKDDFFFDYEPYLQEGMTTPQQPSALMSDVYRRTFPEDATRSAIVALTEGGGSPNPTPYVNKSGSKIGSTDLGSFMINTGTSRGRQPITTFDDLMNRFPEKMRDAGTNPSGSLEENMRLLSDPYVSAEVARINLEDPGNKGAWWNRWFGLRDNGYREEDFNTLERPY